MSTEETRSGDARAQRDADPRVAETADPHAGTSDDPRVEPTAAGAWENRAAGDEAWEDDLTEERQVSPARREEVAHEETLDP